MKAGNQFIGQPLWGSIGYSLPAAFGSQIAAPDSRHFLFIGDGSLQLTVQDLGLALREKLNSICFVLNNDGYTVERAIHGARQGYNDVQMWRYSQLPQAFGATSDQVVTKCVKTELELVQVMTDARQNPNHFLLDRAVSWHGRCASSIE